MEHLTAFWKLIEGKTKPSQLERYVAKGVPEAIQKLIAIGGGPKMGTILEQYARFTFKTLQKRHKGAEQTGYDHLIQIGSGDSQKTVFVEQKSSGHWGDDDFKWQHIEPEHKWTMLLLCGITYTEVKFWAMNRTTFQQLIAAKKITNQGNKAGDSSEGMWMNYSDIKDMLVEIRSDEDLIKFTQYL